jgi:hypothetical protein
MPPPLKREKRGPYRMAVRQAAYPRFSCGGAGARDPAPFPPSTASQVLRLEFPAQVDGAAGDHEDAVAPVCQPMVMMLDFPFQAELTSTIGPGSRNRRISERGKSCFLNVLMHGLYHIRPRPPHQGVPCHTGGISLSLWRLQLWETQGTHAEKPIWESGDRTKRRQHHGQE